MRLRNTRTTSSTTAPCGRSGPTGLSLNLSASSATTPTAQLLNIPAYLREIFYFVPLALALHLQKSGQYLAALDWFRTVYAYDFPVNQRKIYVGLELERDSTPDPAPARISSGPSPWVTASHCARRRISSHSASVAPPRSWCVQALRVVMTVAASAGAALVVTPSPVGTMGVDGVRCGRRGSRSPGGR